MRDVIFLLGPNLDQLGRREPEIYGSLTLEDLSSYCESVAAEFALSASVFQTNSEAKFIEAIHEAIGSFNAIVVNPGAFTHYSYAIADALAIFPGPKVEVHLSNVYSREPWRHRSVVSPVVSGAIVGLGILGFRVATMAVLGLLTDIDAGAD